GVERQAARNRRLDAGAAGRSLVARQRREPQLIRAYALEAECGGEPVPEIAAALPALLARAIDSGAVFRGEGVPRFGLTLELLYPLARTGRCSVLREATEVRAKLQRNPFE